MSDGTTIPIDGLATWIQRLVRAEVDRALAERASPERYLSTAEAAELAGVAEQTVRRWVREGALEPGRAGRLLRFRASDVEKLIRRGPRVIARERPMATPEMEADRFLKDRDRRRRAVARAVGA